MHNEEDKTFGLDAVMYETITRCRRELENADWCPTADLDMRLQC